MKRILTAVVLISALAWPFAAPGVETNTGGPLIPELICAAADTMVQMSFSEPYYAPSGYTLFSNDAALFWFFRRFADGARDTIGIRIPAGRSILVPAPSAISEGGVYTHTIFIGGHTDTVYALPWYK